MRKAGSMRETLCVFVFMVTAGICGAAGVPTCSQSGNVASLLTFMYKGDQARKLMLVLSSNEIWP